MGKSLISCTCFSFLFLLSFATVSNASTDQLHNAYFLLNDYLGSVVSNAPFTLDSTCSDVQAANTPCVTDNQLNGPNAVFTDEPSFNDIVSEGWSYYGLYYNEHSGEGFPNMYNINSNAGGGTGEFSRPPVGDMTVHHEIGGPFTSNLFLAKINLKSGSPDISFGPGDTLSNLGTFSTGCPNFCRGPIGFVWSMFNAGSLIPNISTYAGAYAFIEGLIQSAATSSNAYPTFLIDSDISTSTTFASRGVYKILGDIEINSGVTLTIEPGAVLKFMTATSGLTVNGTLNALGVAGVNEDSVYMTSFLDDAVPPEGDTNNDGSSTTPAAGNWAGITINSGGVVNFEYVTVRYGGAGTGALVHNNGGSFNASTSTFAYGTSTGIKNTLGTTTIAASDLGFNDFGLYLYGGSASITGSSTIHDNEQYGIYNATTNVINATNNWWATSTGPYHSITHATGTGDWVSDYVNYNNWVEEIHYLIEKNCKAETFCGSVNNASSTLYWKWATSSVPVYEDELEDAIVTWNALQEINIIEATSTVDLNIISTSSSEYAWVGLWFVDIYLNTYHLDESTSDEIQHTITHEFGHALGLGHSFTGNIMYSNQTSKTTLGVQDVIDYLFLWQ